MVEAKRIDLINICLEKVGVPIVVKHVGEDAAEVVFEQSKSWYIGSIHQVETYVAGLIKMYQVTHND